MIIRNPHVNVLDFGGTMHYLVENVVVPEDFDLKAVLKDIAEQLLTQPLTPAPPEEDDESDLEQFEQDVKAVLVDYAENDIEYNEFEVTQDGDVVLLSKDSDNDLLFTGAHAKVLRDALKGILRRKVEVLQKLITY